MTTYNTGNPLGSTAVKDLYDNAENFDAALNDPTSDSWTDRLGRVRKTWSGMERQFNSFMESSEEAFQQFLLSSGYQDLGDYAAGLQITSRNQIFRKDGELYRAGAALDLPYTLTGDWSTEGSRFVSVGDAALRQELVSPTGTDLVTYRGLVSGSLPRRLTDALNDRVSIKQFGANGDGSDDSAALSAAASCGRTVYFPPGVYVSEPVVLSPGTIFIGESETLVTIKITVGNDRPCIWIKSNDTGVVGIHIEVNQTVPIGGHGGLFGTAITAGDYFTAAMPEVRRVYIDRIRVTRAVGSEVSNAVMLMGDTADCIIGSIEAVGGLAVFGCHWGAIGTVWGDPLTETFHPHNVQIGSLKGIGSGAQVLFLSASYNISCATVVAESCAGALGIVTGDAGNVAASAEEKDLINSGITIGSVSGTVTAMDAFLVDGEGNYNGSWKRVPYKGLAIGSVSLRAKGGVITPVAVMRDVFGSVDVGTLDIRTDDYTCLGLELERCNGVTIGRYAGDAANGYLVDRSKRVTINQIDLAKPRATTTASSNIGMQVMGNRYASTLVNALAVGDTSITLGAAFPVRAYRGDVIRISATPARYVVVAEEFIPNTGTNLVVAIEPSRFSASAGTAVFLDNYSEDVFVKGGRIHGYPGGLSANSTATYHTRNLQLEGVIFDECGNRDIDLERIDGFRLVNCEFRNGGTRSLSSGGTIQTRAINLNNVRGFHIAGNRIGNEGALYTLGLIYGDRNCIEGLVADNEFGVGLGIGGQDVLQALKDAGRDNVYRNNRQFGGGVVTPVLN